MPYTVTRFQSTPNPNAVKCVLDRTTGEAVRSYFNAGAAQDDPVASALFAIDGVTNVLINDDWITVSKRPDAKWPAIKSAVERALRGVEERGSPTRER